MVKWILVFCLGILLSGCGSYGGPAAHAYQERCPFEPDWRMDPERKPRPTPGNPVFQISLTNQGEWVDRCEYTDLLLELQQDRQPLNIIVYVHGWKHGPGTADHQRFTEYVEMVAKGPAKYAASNPSIKPARTIGVYIAWPGSTITIPGVEELTYWGRQKAADRITQSGVVAKIIAGIQSVRASVSSASKSGRPSDDQLILIGHSFGARILLTATSQTLINIIEHSHPGQTTQIFSNSAGRYVHRYRCMPPKALLILLNPAVEAFTYSAFHNIRRSDHGFATTQQPLLLVVASENDRATRLAFPIGQAFGLNWHSKELATIGNYEPFRTHSLKKGGVCPKRAYWFDAFKSDDDLCLLRDAPAPRPAGPRDLQRSDEALRSSSLLGDDRYPSHEGNPFLMTRTTSDIIDGHGGIWSPIFQRWMSDFVRRANDEREKNYCGAN